ncbi:hypothetical protein MMC27_000434 [Xylographa pallens]|nr:hypothetical protein [Xylographa pallens]
MKFSLLVATAWALLAQAEDTTSPLTFTYSTFTNHTVAPATTTYSLNPSHTSSVVISGTGKKSSSSTHSAPTSYIVNPADLAYPSFSNVVGPLASSAPAPGLLNATQLADEALALILQLKVANSTNCQTCKNVMSTVAARMKVQQETLSDIAVPFCLPLQSFLPMPICIGLLKIGSTDIGGIFPAMDMQGDDGQTICAFMFGSCDLPPPPQLDLNTLFQGTEKPAPRELSTCKKEPLKVLHISDYHLDMRYVVGSEANCTGPVCCRVFPYTNVSTPIEEPASLFGNYLCDTPEALATSVFRSVPKVTGYEWSEFSFGIFTGDLVSHDLWELTEPYVLSEELESYQQFFDGMGGVKLYPTLGNHDTYPHAFTAFPDQNSILPYNASYPVQEKYNYENVSAAWENYGWLTAKEAQMVVNSGLGIYRAVTAEGLVIISLNSDVWYYFNLYAYIGANKIDMTGMFGKLITYLLEAEAKNQAVWLIQHVNVGGSTDYEALPAATDLYYQIIDRFNNTIRGTFFGHTHDDELGVFYTNNATEQTAQTAANVAYIMPSVTAYTNLNAGFRYYLVDPDTFDIIDSLTYYANLSNTNEWTANGDVTWELEYSARDTYDPSGTLLAPNAPLSAAFWHEVTQEIYTNETMFETYTDLRTKKFRPYTPVTGLARNLTLCGLRSMSVPIFERCLGSMQSTTSFL